VVCVAAAAYTLPACEWGVDVVLWDVATIGTRDDRSAKGHSAKRRPEELKIHDNRVKTGVERSKGDVYDDGCGNFSVR
jgi:hypothetical protein